MDPNNTTTDTWSDLQAFKQRQSSIRERMQRRKREREGIVADIITSTSSPSVGQVSISIPPTPSSSSSQPSPNIMHVSEDLEAKILKYLCDSALKLPIDSNALVAHLVKNLRHEWQDNENGHAIVKSLLQKFALQELIEISERLNAESESLIIITSADHGKLITFANEVRDALEKEIKDKNNQSLSYKRKNDESDERENDKFAKSENKPEDLLESLLSQPSIKEKESKKVGEEILALLSKPTAKEKSLAERFRSVGGAQVQEFCQHGTKEECIKSNNKSQPCSRLHFKKIIQKHTDETLGDCSFLNTCFHMDSCKYVHYEVDYSTLRPKREPTDSQSIISSSESEPLKVILYPPQWIRCDLRYFDMSILGKFSVVMADPPWDIHMELPYGTMSDEEMRNLNIPCLQDKGLIFLWVTGRAMETGRDCLKRWGYDRCDEIIWVKTNQLQRIIRTGRTGHWINHGKEHCLVGVKGDPDENNRGLDCDVIVAEVRATSHKPDEIYGIIERLSPGTKKIELFGRQHNSQPNWVTLGNQVDGVRLFDPVLVEAYRKKYPNVNC